MKFIRLLSLASLLYIVGCAPTQNTIFYWGNYSSTLYKYKKTPDEKNRAAYKASLKDILDNAKKKYKKIPPGVQAEYGFLLIKEGDVNSGQEDFAKEIQMYPESKDFVSKLQEELSKGNQ